MTEREAERAAIVAELRKRIAKAWHRQRVEELSGSGNAEWFYASRVGLESAADYIEAGKHTENKT